MLIVSIIVGYTTNHLKTWWLKTMISCFSLFLGQEFRKFGWVAFLLHVALGYIQLVAGRGWKLPGAFTPPFGSLHMGYPPLVTKPELLSSMVADCPQRA